MQQPSTGYTLGEEWELSRQEVPRQGVLFAETHSVTRAEVPQRPGAWGNPIKRRSGGEALTDGKLRLPRRPALPAASARRRRACPQTAGGCSTRDVRPDRRGQREPPAPPKHRARPARRQLLHLAARRSWLSTSWVTHAERPGPPAGRWQVSNLPSATATDGEVPPQQPWHRGQTAPTGEGRVTHGPQPATERPTSTETAGGRQNPPPRPLLPQLGGGLGGRGAPALRSRRARGAVTRRGAAGARQ